MSCEANIFQTFSRKFAYIWRNNLEENDDIIHYRRIVKLTSIDRSLCLFHLYLYDISMPKHTKSDSRFSLAFARKQCASMDSRL